MFLWLLIKFGIWWYGMGLSAGLGVLAILLAAAVTLPRCLMEFSAAAVTVYRHADSVPELTVPTPEVGTSGDPAYPGYFYGQVYRDFRYLVSNAGTRSLALTRKLLKRVIDLWNEREEFAWRSLLFLPMVGSCVGLIVGAVAAAVLVALFTMVYFVILAAATALVTGVGGALWTLESVTLTVRGITLECPDCHERVSRPTYICSGDGGCHAEHVRLVPGRLGVFRRICRCGRSLPTLLFRGKNSLAAKCADCGTELPLHGLTAATTHIPVAGGPSVGKSVFMFAAVSRLHDDWVAQGDSPQLHFWADRRFADQFARTRSAIEDPASMRKTTEARPRAYNIYVGSGGARRLLYLYDSAGEGQLAADDLAGAKFYRFARGVTICVDPFSLRGVRRNVNRAVLDDVRSRAVDPRISIDAQVENLRENLSTKVSDKLPVAAAVVLTKGDALVRADVRHPYAESTPDRSARLERSELVRSWLEDDAGRPDIVASLLTSFQRVSFFVVSHVDATRLTDPLSMHDDPAAPLRWILDGR